MKRSYYTIIAATAAVAVAGINLFQTTEKEAKSEVSVEPTAAVQQVETEVNELPKAEAKSFKQILRDNEYNFTPETALLNQLVDTKTTSIEQFRGQMCAKGVPEYIGVHEDRSSQTVISQKTEDFLNNKWEFNGDTYHLPTPIDWDADPYNSRTWRYQFNAWRPIHAAFTKWNLSLESNPELSQRIEAKALSFSLDWIENNYFPGEDYRTGDQSSFTWYDMAAGHRAAVLGQLVRVASCNNGISDDQFLAFLRSSADHLKYLAADRFHVGHNNHGIYQSIGTVMLCHRVPELQLCPPSMTITEERIQSAFDKSFSDEGVHKEHSPRYHFYMLEVLEVLNRISSFTDFSEQTENQISSIYRDSQEALAWFIKPNRKLAQFGDTDEKYLNINEIEQLVGEKNVHPLLRWSLTPENSDRPSNEDFRIFYDAGYAIFKQGAVDHKKESAAYLAMAAAFHSRVHKHIDDLSIEWSDVGQDILVEPGMYGYEGRTGANSELRKIGFYYDHPARIYVESPHAHNTVEINNSPDNRRSVKPYGSGIQSGGMTNEGWFQAIASVPRHENFKQTRIIVSAPQEWLLVVDQVENTNEMDTTEDNQFTQWFHLNPTAIRSSNSTGLGEFTINDLTVSFIDLNEKQSTYQIVKGEKEPRYQGWHSNQAKSLIPNFAIGTTKNGRNATFATLINISGKNVVSSSFERSEDNNGFKASWTYDDGETVVVPPEDFLAKK